MTIRANRFVETERRIREAMDITLDDIEVIVGVALEDAADKHREIILEEGVHNTVANSNGRIDSGKMYDAVETKLRRNGRGRITGQVGFLSDYEDYFGYQEVGTLSKGQPSGDPSPVPGTRRGILPLMAMKRVNQQLRDDIDRETRQYRK